MQIHSSHVEADLLDTVKRAETLRSSPGARELSLEVWESIVLAHTDRATPDCNGRPGHFVGSARIKVGARIFLIGFLEGASLVQVGVVISVSLVHHRASRQAHALERMHHLVVV